MKLDRNITNPRRGKYALIKLRIGTPTKKTPGGEWHVPSKAIDFGEDLEDFFVIRLKDKYAADALHAYADAAYEDGEEYSAEIRELAISAQRHPTKKRPD